MNHRNESSVIVVGGGVFGVAGAWELVRRGCQVTLLDTGKPPRAEAASTDISKVVRFDYGADTFYTEMAEEAMEGWRRWNMEAGVALFHECGVLYIVGEKMAEGEFEYESLRVLKERGHPIDTVDAASMESRFPAWRAGRFKDGFFNPRGGWAESGRALAWMIDSAKLSGLRVVEDARVEGLATNNGSVDGVILDSGRELNANRTVFATGAWTLQVIEELSSRLRPVGQPVLHFAPEDVSPFLPKVFPVWTADVSDTGWYGFPADTNGIVKVANHGTGWEADPDGPRGLPEEIEEDCRSFLREALPALANAPLESGRTCLYCDTHNGDYLIDQHPSREGLFVATGGSGHAFKFAPVLGGIIADVVLGASNKRAQRFKWEASPDTEKEATRAGEPDARLEGKKS